MGYLKPIYESTSENIEKALTAFKDKYETNCINTVTTDGAPNIMRSATNFLRKSNQRCFAHSCRFF